VEVCQALLTETPETRKVSDFLTVSYKGREFDVRGVPRVMVGEKLHITLNPWVLDAAMVVDTDADGNEVLHSIPLVARDDAGFRVDGNVIGEDWTRPADTQLEANRKEVDRFAYAATTDAEVEAKRKAKAVPFGGRIDPGKVIDQAPERTFMPRRGTELAPSVTTSRTAATERVLNGFEAAAELRRKGLEMTREITANIRAWYPDGVPEGELDALHARLTVRSSLRVVAGGAS
jgi:hypothetical protein